MHWGLLHGVFDHSVVCICSAGQSISSAGTFMVETLCCRWWLRWCQVTWEHSEDCDIIHNYVQDYFFRKVFEFLRCIWLSSNIFFKGIIIVSLNIDKSGISPSYEPVHRCWRGKARHLFCNSSNSSSCSMNVTLLPPQHPLSTCPVIPAPGLVSHARYRSGIAWVVRCSLRLVHQQFSFVNITYFHDKRWWG